MANQIIFKKSAGAAPATQLSEAEPAYAEHATKGGELYIGAIGAGSNVLVGAEDSAKKAGAIFTGKLTLTSGAQTDPNDASTIAYAESALSATWEAKASAKAATTVVLADAYTATAVTLTATTNVAFPDTIDAVAINEGDSLLIKNELTTLRKNNGIYELTDKGLAGDHPWILTRREDANTSAEVKRGMNLWVDDGGTENGLSQWIMNAPDPVLGTDIITFEKVSGLGTIVAGTGLEIVGNVIQVANAGVGSVQLAAAVAGDGLAGGAGTVLSVTAGTAITSGATLFITSAGITETQLHASVAGDGVAGGNGVPLSVDAGSGITVNVANVALDFGFTATEVLEGNSIIDAGTWV